MRAVQRLWVGILVMAVAGLAGSTPVAGRVEEIPESTTECPDDTKLVNIVDYSSVRGAIKVSPQAGNPSDNVYLSRTSTVAPQATTPPTPQIGALSANLVLPDSVAPPANATDLGNTLFLRGQTKSLGPGTYKADRLILIPRSSSGTPVYSTLYTYGAVDLYVTGSVIQNGGRLYGQPERVFRYNNAAGVPIYSYPSSTSDWNYFTPSNLRIIVVPSPNQSPSVNLSGGLTAALVYATEDTPVTIANHTLLGAAIGRQVTATNSTVYYHEDLTGARFSVFSTNPVAIQDLFKLARVPLNQINQQFDSRSAYYWNPWEGGAQENRVWFWMPTYGGWWSWAALMDGSYQSGGGGGGGGGQQCGCFLAGTPITLADGSTRPIEALRVGDQVLAFDEATKTFTPDAVKQTFVHDHIDGYLLVNDTLRVTPNHPVFSNGRWVEIGTLKVGDQLLNAAGHPEPIRSLVYVPEVVTVYNLEVNPYHTYVAGGIVAHNKMQEPCMN